MSTLVLIAIPAVGFAVSLIGLALCVAAGRADAHLDAMRDTESFPHSVEPGDGTPGSTHPFDETQLVWLWPPAVDYHRERRQG